MQNRFLYIALGLCGFLTLVVALYFCQFGLEYTDESYYIQLLTNPGISRIHVPLTYFGFIYHPLFAVLDYDLVALRRVNMVAIFAFAGALSYSVLRVRLNFSQSHAASFALALAATALACFRAWAISPNYNTLAFEGIMMALTGLVWTLNPNKRVLFAAWTMLAIGGWLVFMGKPPAAALFGIAMVIYLIATKYRLWGYPVYAGVLALLTTIVSLLIIDHGSFSAAVARIAISIDAVKSLGSGHTFEGVMRLDGPDLGVVDWIYVILGSAALAWSAHALAQGRKPLMQDVFCFVVIALSALVISTGTKLASFDGVEQIGFALAALATCWWLKRKGVALVWRKDLVLLGAFLFFTPYIYAFGTNGNYWKAGGEVCFFWGLSAVVFMWPVIQSKAGMRAVLPLLCLILLFGVMQLNRGIIEPYRQSEPLRAMRATVPFAGGVVTKAQSFADYDQTYRTLAADNGFADGMPMIDLTGRSPGVMYILKADPLGQPWMVGGYKGGSEFARYVLATEACADIAKAWLMLEPEGVRHLDAARVVASMGGDINTDYAKTSDFRTPVGAGGYQDQYTQYFMKPVRPYDEAVAACEKARQSQEQK